MMYFIRFLLFFLGLEILYFGIIVLFEMYRYFGYKYYIDQIADEEFKDRMLEEFDAEA